MARCISETGFSKDDKCKNSQLKNSTTNNHYKPLAPIVKTLPLIASASCL